MQSKQKKNQILKDFITNIIAAVIPIALLQVVIFPQLAKIKGEEVYGFIVTIISVMTLFSDSYGNVLNNVRLLQDDKYVKKGDFNYIIVVGTAFNLIAVLCGCIYYGTDTRSIIGVLVASTLILLRAYYIVAFRLILSYKNILINNIILATGYFLGFVVFIKMDCWSIIYIFGNAFSLIHLYLKSRLMREPVKKTILFKETFGKFSILYIADFLKTFITYADKLLIYPILGAQAVAYYYAASVMGKMMSMGITPVSSVILSYVVKEKKLHKRTINKILSLLALLSLIGFVIAYLAGRILLGILYTAWYEMTIILLPWTVLAALLGGVSSVIQPFILKFKSEFYQIAINILHVVIYVASSIILSKKYGLLGFCIGYCITMGIKLIINLALIKSIGRESEE